MRIFLNIFLFVSVIFFPPYISMVFIFLFIFLYEHFIESIFWAFLLDTIYGSGAFWGVHLPYLFTIGITIIFIISFRFKKMVRFYSHI